MITLLVDESYAFDYLSILELKTNLDLNDSTKLSTYEACKKHIIEQIGIELFEKIILSDEYEECCHSNYITFKAVDLAKTDSVTASYVDKCNFKRFESKKKLQAKFFNNEPVETKVGYERYA